MKKKILIGILIILVVVLAAVVMTSGHINRDSLVEMRQGHLYAIKIDNVPVIIDETDRMWEVPWLNEIDSEDTVLLELKGGELVRTWVLVSAETENLEP